MRNHDPEIMIEAFRLVRLGEDDVKSKFPAMYNAFCYGARMEKGLWQNSSSPDSSPSSYMGKSTIQQN